MAKKLNRVNLQKGVGEKDKIEINYQCTILVYW